MDTKEFEKIINEPPQRVDEETVKENLLAAEDPGTDPGQDPGQDPGDTGTDQPEQVKMSLGDVAGLVAGMYCRASDFVYKKVRKTDFAPEWTDKDKESLQNAFAPVLSAYNVTISPTTNLFIALVVIEGMRYTVNKNELLLQQGGGQNE